MLTEKDYCDYDTCVALKELGYVGTQGECCYFGAYYQNGNDIFYDRLCNPELGEDEYLRVPLYLAQKWLREEKGIGITIYHGYYHDTGELFYGIEIYNTKHWLTTFGEFKYWNVALLEGIKEAVKLLKEEK